MPCDRNVAQIEKLKRLKEYIYIPEEWFSLVQRASKKFHVVKVTRRMVKDYRSFLTPIFVKVMTTEKSQPFQISKYKYFVYNCNFIKLAKNILQT